MAAEWPLRRSPGAKRGRAARRQLHPESRTPRLYENPQRALRIVRLRPAAIGLVAIGDALREGDPRAFEHLLRAMLRVHPPTRDHRRDLTDPSTRRHYA